MKAHPKDFHDKPEIAEMQILRPERGDTLSENQFSFTRAPAGAPTRLARFGNALERYQPVVSRFQWTMVFLYLALLLIPALTSLPQISLFSRLVLWGIGWPLIVLSMMLTGRFWCGIFCPDGTLTEFISRHGKKRSIPRWIRWKGWPCTMLVGTALYGQATGFYESFPATLVLLGIPTCFALMTGYLYGNGKRVWCMYLCPGNGFFGLLAKLAPVHFQVDREKWNRFTGTPKRINCAPLINIRQMQSASACHACGRCSGYRDAVELAARNPATEIVSAKSETVPAPEIFLLLWGVIGICTMSLAWQKNGLYRRFAELVHSLDVPSRFNTPTWFPDCSASLYRLVFIIVGGTLVSLLVYGFLRAADKIAGNGFSWKQLAFCLLPVAGWGIFLGLCRISASVWEECGFSFSGTVYFETALLVPGTILSLWLGIKIIMHRFSLKNAVAMLIYCFPVALLDYLWLG